MKPHDFSRLAIVSLLALSLSPQTAASQDFFDWLNGPPPKKKEDTFKSDVPTPVQRDTLPDLAPAPAGPGGDAPDSRYSADGEPVVRDPEGRAYDDRQAPQDTGGQFDPLEARRSRVEGSRAPAPAQQPLRWEKQEGAQPAAVGRERDAPGSFEDEQGAAPVQSEQYEQGRQPDTRRQTMRDDRRQPEPDGFQQRRAPTGDEPADAPRAPNLRDDTRNHAMRDAARDTGGGGGGAASYDPWAGLSVADLETALSKLDLPPHSPVLHALWLELITARSAQQDTKFAAVRADALNRTGLIREASDALAQAGDVSADPVIATLAARTAIGAGQKDQGCEIARSLTSAVAAKMPQHLKGEVILIAGYCAAASDNKAAAGIAAELAMENGLKDHAGPEALKAIASGGKPAIAQGKKVSLLDYRILQLAGSVDVSFAIPTASPALLAVLARDTRSDPATRLAAAEAAANLNAISADELAAAYREAAGGRPQAELSDAAANAGQPSRRAELFATAETERTPARKARIIRAFLDDARRAGFYWPALQLMARPANDLQPAPEIGWFAETAIEASLAGGNFGGVRRWANFAASQENQGRGDLRHWLALADIAEPEARDRSRHLAAIENMAQHGRFDAGLLHRLATVLDALDTAVPIPLWEAASRTPQPSGGHLPDTGVLSRLQDATKKRDFTQTVLLTMRTIGPNGADGANMIALGDALRGLKRAGMEAEARRLALEALFPAWPRANNS